MEGWVTKPISEVICKTATTDPRKLPEEKFQYVDVSGVSNKTLEITEANELLGSEAPSRARRVISEGNVIFATVRPTLKRIAVVPSTLDGEVCSTGYFVFQPNKELYNRYLFYFLQSDYFMGEMERLQAGASYPAVNDTQVKSTLISYPPTPEQKRIVAILDQAFADIEQARAKTEQNLKNARELFESYLQQVFSQRGEGWVETTLDNLVTDDCSLSYGIVQPGDDVIDGLPVVRPTDMKKELIDSSGLKLIDSSKAEGYKRTTLQGGELLVCVRGATGVTSIACNSLAGANVTRGIVPVRFNQDKIFNRFGYYLFISPWVQKQIKEATYGAALMQINIKDFRKIKISVPPLDMQSKLIDKLDGIRPDLTRIEKIYDAKLLALDELKKSILKKAFSGEF